MEDLWRTTARLVINDSRIQWRLLSIWVIYVKILQTTWLLSIQHLRGDLFLGTIFLSVSLFGGGHILFLSILTSGVFFCVCINFTYSWLLQTKLCAWKKPSLKSFKFVPLGGQRKQKHSPLFLLIIWKIGTAWNQRLYLKDFWLYPHTFGLYLIEKSLLQFWLGLHWIYR